MKVYVQDDFIIGKATEPYLQCFAILDAPDEPLDRLTVKDGAVVVSDGVPDMVIPSRPATTLTVRLPEAKPLMDIVKEKLLGETLTNLDYKLLLLSVTVISLYNLNTEPELLATAMEKLREYVNSTSN